MTAAHVMRTLETRALLSLNLRPGVKKKKELAIARLQR